MTRVRRSASEVYNEVQRLEGAMEQLRNHIDDRLNQLSAKVDQVAIMLFNEQRGWLPQLEKEIREVPNALRRALNG